MRHSERVSAKMRPRTRQASTPEHSYTPVGPSDEPMYRSGGTFALPLSQHARLHEPLSNPTTLPWRHYFSSWRLRNIYGQADCSPPRPHLGPHRTHKHPGTGGHTAQTYWRTRSVLMGQGPPHANPHGPNDTNSKNHHPPRWHDGLYRYLPLGRKWQA
jgi:hypothetical protein